MESSSSVITPEDVMGTLMNDGTIDSMRLKIITQLKANEELKNTTIKMVEQSRVLYTSGAEKQTKRELFDALRQELERCYFQEGGEIDVVMSIETAYWRSILTLVDWIGQVNMTKTMSYFKIVLLFTPDAF